MKGPSRFLLALIILVTLWAVSINLPDSINVPFNVNNVFPFLVHGKTTQPNHTLKLPSLSNIFGLFHIQSNYSIRRGLDLEGGTQITLQANMQSIPVSQRDNALASAQKVIENRVNFYGVSEPVVQTAKTNNSYRIEVEIPGVTDVNQAVALVGQTAKLTFWEEGPVTTKTATPSANLPYGVSQFLGPNAKETNLSGADLKSASVSFDSQSGEPQVLLQFTSEGTKKFADITRRNVGKYVAIVLDNMLVSAPRVNEVIPNGNASITGSFTTDQANSLQIQLNAGALPVPLTVLQQQTIGATLGQASLQKSLFAGILGFVIIVVFMISLYGRLGAIASTALILYTLLDLGLFRTIPVTLTLAGIAGFILSIGIAVDANILIFERMREEMRRGYSRERAIELGFARAWTSIRDSNAASIITSLILFYFGTGEVRGFALTLFIGVLVSLFSAVVVTRTLLRLTYKTKLEVKN
ncbi:MAG TPA: protein translocase subunit SecD [Patescibacteria group bacterium]|nr:protein translocase subunit SecD [Patescibacteria group bacterium]